MRNSRTLLVMVAATAVARPSLADDTKLVTTIDGTSVLGGEVTTMTPDGRFVLFISNSPDYVADDLNGMWDLFVKDLEFGTIERVNVASDGSEAPGGIGWSDAPGISADGRFVAFTTDATFDAADNAKLDVYLRDRVDGTTTLVSHSTHPALLGRGSNQPFVTRDGAWVFFVSSRNSLVDGDLNPSPDVFAWERATGEITLVSTDSAGASIKGPCDGLIRASADGSAVLFQQKTGVGEANTFVKDRTSGVLEQIDGNESGTAFASKSFPADLSPDGRFVLFGTTDALVAADTNGCFDSYVRDRFLATVERVTLGTGGREIASDARATGMSDGARRIAFTTIENASGDDDNGIQDAFVFDRDTGVALRVSLGPNDEVGLDASAGATLSADGHLALFASNASSLWAGDDNWRNDVFLRVISSVAAAWTNYGSGLDGRFGIPALTLDALPRRNATPGLHVGNSSGLYTASVLFVGLASASLPTSLGGTLLLVPFTSMTVPLSPWGTTVPVTIPSGGDLPGVHVYLQVLELDPWAVKGVSFTAGLDLTIGD
jgi:Tol biopolymer transport system component